MGQRSDKFFSVGKHVPAATTHEEAHSGLNSIKQLLPSHKYLFLGKVLKRVVLEQLQALLEDTDYLICFLTWFQD